MARRAQTNTHATQRMTNSISPGFSGDSCDRSRFTSGPEQHQLKAAQPQHAACETAVERLESALVIAGGVTVRGQSILTGRCSGKGSQQ